MWAQCPHRWKTAYIDGNREFKESIHTLFGKSMHEVIQTFLTVMYNDTVKLAEQLPLEDAYLDVSNYGILATIVKNGKWGK